MANYGYDAATGVIQGIIKASEERKKGKQQVLQAFMQDPQAASFAFPQNKIDAVMTPQSQSGYEDLIQHRKNFEIFKQLDPRVQAALGTGAMDSGQPLDEHQIFPAVKQIVDEDKKRYDRQVKTQENSAILTSPYAKYMPADKTIADLDESDMTKMSQMLENDTRQQALVDHTNTAYLNQIDATMGNPNARTIMQKVGYNPKIEPYKQLEAANAYLAAMGTKVELFDIFKAAGINAPGAYAVGQKKTQGEVTIDQAPFVSGTLPTGTGLGSGLGGGLYGGAGSGLPDGFAYNFIPGSKVPKVTPLRPIATRPDGIVVLNDADYQTLMQDPRVSQQFTDTEKSHYISETESQNQYTDLVGGLQNLYQVVKASEATKAPITADAVAAAVPSATLDKLKIAAPGSPLLIKAQTSSSGTYPVITTEDISDTIDQLKKHFIPRSRAAAGQIAMPVPNAMFSSDILYKMTGSPNVIGTSAPSAKRRVTLNNGEVIDRAHKGNDYAVRLNTPIAYPFDTPGIVSDVRRSKEGGNEVLVRFIDPQTGLGMNMAIAHNNSINVKKGQTITKGTVLSMSGNTGTSIKGKASVHIQFVDDNGVVYKVTQQGLEPALIPTKDGGYATYQAPTQATPNYPAFAPTSKSSGMKITMQPAPANGRVGAPAPTEKVRVVGGHKLYYPTYKDEPDMPDMTNPNNSSNPKVQAVYNNIMESRAAREILDRQTAAVKKAEDKKKEAKRKADYAKAHPYGMMYGTR